MLIGVLGAGQLGRMLALAGLPLGLRFRFLDPAEHAPAGQLAEQVVGSFEDEGALARFADGLDAATLEFENVPVSAARWLAARVPMWPPPVALETGQDRLAEKTLFQEMGLEVHPFAAARNVQEFVEAVARVGTPVVVKTLRGGYDGKGQAVIRESVVRAELERVWASMGGVALLVEKFVPFERELSVVAVRSRVGEFRAYPLVRNVHAGGILRESVSPVPGLDESLRERAERYAKGVMDRLGYVGVMAIEFFEVGGALLANEMAPRVHNTGHLTIEGAVTSQFENHCRAVAGLPLGETSARGHSVMINLVGNAPESGDVLAVEGAHLHLYGKEPRPGRKIGHITVTAQTHEHAAKQAAVVRRVVDACTGR